MSKTQTNNNREGQTMSNMIDITNMTDAALDVFLRSEAGETVDASNLTPKERYTVAQAMRWDVTSDFVMQWIRG